MPLLDDEAYARRLDAADPLAGVRERFYLPAGQIYLDGNSLGLLSRDAERELARAIDQWRRLGIAGWSQAELPWFFTGERLGAAMAPLVGASPDEVVATGTTTVNLHSLVATFYQPAGRRRAIVCTDLDFPSDRYALASEIELRGGDPTRDLVAVPSRDGRLVEEDDLIAAMGDEVALALLPGALYRSGQLLDMARLTAAAHARGVVIGFDCAHSIGVVGHHFDEWEVDFAVWCGYKYLNGGPGSVAGLYVSQRHFGLMPALRGWWGNDKERQFDMAPEFVAAGHAGGWQISSASLFASAALAGSLAIFAEVGLDAIRAKSLALTDYLIALMDELAPDGFRVGTPREHSRRGGHVAVEHDEGARIGKALKARGVIPDFRPPDVVRLAPIALYTSFHEVWQAARHLKAICDNEEWRDFPPGRDLVA